MKEQIKVEKGKIRKTERCNGPERSIFWFRIIFFLLFLCLQFFFNFPRVCTQHVTLRTIKWDYFFLSITYVDVGSGINPRSSTPKHFSLFIYCDTAYNKNGTINNTQFYR